MNPIEEKCQKKGVRLTIKERQLQSDFWVQRGIWFKDHPDVDELHKVSSLDNKISIATVYRTVKLFEEAGILVKHDFKAGKADMKLMMIIII